MKYLRGNKVKIIDHRTAEMNEQGGMDKYLNTIMTIKHVNPTFYTMKEDFGLWIWTDKMIKTTTFKRF